MPPSLVQERAKARHEAALAALSASIVEINQVEDNRSSATIADLELFLAQSNSCSDDLLEREAARIDAHKTHLQELSFIVSQGEGNAPLLEDEYHVAHLDSIHNRERLAVRRREELLRNAFGTFDGYTQRMAAIDVASKTLSSIEKSRKKQMQRALDELGSAVSAAAFVHETALQVIVQRANHAVNKQLLANQSSLSTYIADARQMEILQQRRRLQDAAELYNSLVESIRHSFLLHTLQLVQCDTFIAPAHRGMLLKQAQRRHAGIHSDVGHALFGLTSLAQGLLDVRTSSPLKEICGGTKDNGWLRFFTDDFHLPVFAAPITTVSQEWKAFLTVILNGTRVANVSLLEDVQREEDTVMHRAEEAKALLETQLRNLYEATEVEEDLISRCSLHEEFTYPLHDVLNNRYKADNVVEEVSALLEEPFAVLHIRSKSFVSRLKTAMELNEEYLTDRLLSGERSIVEYVHDGSIHLNTIATQAHTILRRLWISQEEETNDYFDNKSALEAAFAQCSRKLSDCRTEAEAGALYVEGMELLGSIEELYHTYHSNCIDPMPTVKAELKDVLTGCRERLFGLLRVDVVKGSSVVFSEPHWRLRESPVPVVVADTPTVEALPVKKVKGAKKTSTTPAPDTTPTPVPPTAPLTPIPWLVEDDTPDEFGFDSLIRVAFFRECYISEGEVQTYLAVLRERLVRWVLQLEERCVRAVDDFCTERKLKLDTVVNELVRQHLRRPPAFQSNVYEGRIRELEQTHQHQQQSKDAIKKTLGSLRATIHNLCESSADHMRADHEVLMLLVDAVPSQNSKDALDVQTRRFYNQASKVGETIQQRKTLLHTKLEELHSQFQRECDSADSRSVDRAMTEQVMALREEGEEARDALDDAINNEIEQEEEMYNDVVSCYDAAKEKSAAELEFLSALGAILASLKGRVNALMLTNSNELQELGTLVSSLEGVLGEPETTSTFLQLKDLQPAEVKEVDALTARHNEDLSTRLRKVQTSLGATFQDSRAERLLAGFIKLRAPLLKVGSQLGCLHHGVELTAIPAGCLVNPPKELTDGLTYIQPIVSPAPTKSRGAKTKDSPSKGSPPPQVPTQANVNLPFTVDDDGVAIPKTVAVPPEKCIIDIVQAMVTNTTAEIQLRVQDYFSSTGQSCLMRTHVYGGTPAEMLKSCGERAEEQAQRVSAHCFKGSSQYRTLMHRVQVASAEGAEVMMKSLVRSCMESLGQKLAHVLGVFEDYHSSFEGIRKHHNSKLKGSLAFPSNRGELAALTAAEQQRQTLARNLVMTLWGVSQREAQNEATRASVRLSSAFMFYAWAQIGMITPAHVIPGDTIVEGRHRGLRRLLMKSEKAAAVPAAAPEEAKSEAPSNKKGANKGNKDDKKAPRKATTLSPTLAADAPSSTPEALPLLVRPMSVYAGVRLGLVPALTEFAAIHPGVAAGLVDHYLSPVDWGAAPESRTESPSPTPAQEQPRKASSSPAAAKKVVQEAPQVPTAAPVLLKVRAPTDEPIQRAYNARSILIATLTKNIVSVAQECNVHFGELLAADEAWVASWAQGVAKLKASS